jgi:site-specific DNA-methyltransferase (adenine-specific)
MNEQCSQGSLSLNTVHCMDAKQGMLLLPCESVDLIVTSPPYKEADGYRDALLYNVARHCYRVSKVNSLCFVNFGHLAHYKSRPFEVAMMFQDAGYRWIDTITWVKTQYSPIQGEKRLNNVTEFVFQFAKGLDYELNRLSIGVPYTDKSNVGRYSDVDLRCGGNVWVIPYETIQRKEQKLHPNRFPLELPRRCIELANIPAGAVVLDPFMGSGTTAVVAKMMEKQFIGFDVDPKCCEIANSRIARCNAYYD